MNEEKIEKVFQMISSAGAARSKYMEAIAAAKKGDFDGAKTCIEEGGKMFTEAHHVHADMLAQESENMCDGDASQVSLVLVHAEDQMMCAETFRIIAEELIDVYKKIN